MNLQTGSFYVAGDVWEAIELDQKEQMVKIVSLYRDGEFGLPQVRLYESRSGKELAVYGPFTGVTIR